MNTESPFSISKTVILVGAAFLLGYLYVVYASYTAAPQHDSWRFFVEDGEFATGILRHNEHIINFIAFIFRIDNVALVGQGFLQLALIAAMLAGLAALFASQLAPQQHSWGASSLVVAACLSATQFTNIVWPFQVGFVGCFAFGVFAAWCLSKAATTKSTYQLSTISFMLACLSALSIAAGVILLPILACYALLLPLGRRAKIGYAVAALALFALLLAVNVSGEGDLGAKSPLRAMAFGLAVLGSLIGAAFNWSWLGLGASPMIQVALSVFAGGALSAIALTVVLQSYGDRSKAFLATIHWTIPIGLWIALSAAAIGYGRSYMPMIEALSARYVTLSVVYLSVILVAVSQAWPTIAQNSAFNGGCAVFVCILAVAQIDRMAQGEVAGRRFESAESALLNSDFSSKDIGYLYPESMDKSARYVSEIMKLRGLSVFGQKRYHILGTNLFAGFLKFRGNCPANFSEINRGRDSVRIQGSFGQSTMPFRPDAVVLADAGSLVTATGTVRRRMLGLHREGRTGGFVVNASSPVPGGTSLFLADLDNLSFCYAGTI